MTTKLKPFNLEKALAGEKVVTRDGRNVVEIVKLNKTEVSRSVIAVIEGQTWYAYTVDGRYGTQQYSPFDLLMVSTKKQGWINIYDNNPTETGRRIFSTKQEAEDTAGSRLITTVMIEWEE